MTLDSTGIGSICKAFQQDARRELTRLGTLDKKIRGKLVRTWMPDDADLEYKDLLRKAAGPWLEFSADAISQGVRVDGYTDADVWARGWQANGMDGRQNGVTRETVRLGKSFIMVMPATGGIDDNGDEVIDPDNVVMRPASSLESYAVFDDPYDKYPRYFLTRVGPTRPANFWDSKWIFVDDTAFYRFTGKPEAPTNLTILEHGRAYTPVALIPNTLPTTGEPESSVERAIPVYQRIVDATFTLEMVQRYGAFPQKWVTGATLGENVRISADSMLEANAADPLGNLVKFGNFTQASLADVVVAKDSHIKDLAAVCQVPPHYLLGAVVNMSAEGIAAAESGYFRNIGERQDSIGEGYELSLRIAADYLGNETAANDTSSQVHFEDVSSRSLAQISDAIVKLSTLKTPLDMLFKMIPGWTQTDAAQAAAIAEKSEQKAAQQEQTLALVAAQPAANPQQGPPTA